MPNLQLHGAHAHSSAGLTFQQFSSFLIVTALLLPVCVIAAMCTAFTISSRFLEVLAHSYTVYHETKPKECVEISPHAAKTEFSEPN